MYLKKVHVSIDFSFTLENDSKYVHKSLKLFPTRQSGIYVRMSCLYLYYDFGISQSHEKYMYHFELVCEI